MPLMRKRERLLDVADPAVTKRKQLEFELSTIETSALTMLLPHLEICRTIITAYAAACVHSRPLVCARVLK